MTTKKLTGNAFKIALAVAFILPATNLVAQNPQTDEVALSEKRQIKLEDKLSEAQKNGKSVIILFGEQDNKDLRQTYQELDEKRDKNSPLILVIDPALEKPDSLLRRHIDEEIGKKRGLHSAVFKIERDNAGTIGVGKAVFSSWGYKSDLTQKLTSQANAAQSALNSATTSGTTTGSGKQSNSATGTSGASTVTKVDASSLQHIKNTSTTIQSARAALMKEAQAKNLDLKRLNNRADQFEQRALNGVLTTPQVISSYEKLTELLESKSYGPHFDQSLRNALVELTLHNLARPRSIDQGNHPTCNVTTLEVYLAARHPEVYSDIVSQVTLTGSYVTLNKETVTPAKAALMPGLDEKAFNIDTVSMNKRNHASQIVQMTLANGVYQTGRYHEKQDSKGNKLDRTGWSYIVGPPVKTYFRVGSGWAYTTDEDQLLNEHGKPVIGRNGKPVRTPNLIGDDILAASDMVLGYEMPYLEAPYQITGQPWVYDLPTAKRLLKFKTDGMIPLGVHTMGGMHVQTIHDVVLKNNTCWILIDNQRGAKEDGWIKLETLHRTQKSMNYQFTPHKSIP